MFKVKYLSKSISNHCLNQAFNQHFKPNVYPNQYQTCKQCQMFNKSKVFNEIKVTDNHNRANKRSSWRLPKASKAGQSALLARPDDRHPQPIRAIQDHVTALAVSCWLHVTCHVPRAVPRDLPRDRNHGYRSRIHDDIMEFSRPFNICRICATQDILWYMCTTKLARTRSAGAHIL